MERKNVDKNEVKARRAGAKKSISPKTISIAAILAVLFVGILVFFIFSSNNKKDVFIGDINVSGKTLEQIKESLSELEGAFDDSSVSVAVEGIGELRSVSAQEIGLKFNLDKTAEAAFNFVSQQKGAGIGKKSKIDYVFDYDAIALRNITAEITQAAGGDLKEHEIVIEDSRVVIKSGKSGKGISAGVAADAILKGFKPHTKTTVELKMETTAPKDISVDELYTTTKRDVSNATYKYENGKLIISNEINGREIDKSDAESKLNGFKEGSADIYIDFKIIPASLTKAQLEAKLFKDVLGEFSSKYNAGNVNRTANVEKAAMYINGKVLLPGEVFSYNQTVGPRTADRGFKVASIYEANRVADGMGGGICQTCSTLYPAVLYADLEVIERTNHSLEVSYVPLGMDATVAWNSLDFKFRNSTQNPIKITSTYGGGTVRIKILGTKESLSKSIKVVTERTSYTPFTVKEVVDPTLAPGQRVNVSNGFNGSTVNTYKVYYENGVEVKRVNLGRSTYRMAEKIVNVGPEPTASPEPPPTEAPQPSPGDTTTDIPAPSQTPDVGGQTPTPQAPEQTQPATEPTSPQAPMTEAEIIEEYPEGI